MRGRREMQRWEDWLHQSRRRVSSTLKMGEPEASFSTTASWKGRSSGSHIGIEGDREAWRAHRSAASLPKDLGWPMEMAASSWALTFSSKGGAGNVEAE